jgi:hypothetical protein
MRPVEIGNRNEKTVARVSARVNFPNAPTKGLYFLSLSFHLLSLNGVGAAGAVKFEALMRKTF